MKVLISMSIRLAFLFFKARDKKSFKNIQQAGSIAFFMYRRAWYDSMNYKKLKSNIAF